MSTTDSTDTITGVKRDIPDPTTNQEPSNEISLEKDQSEGSLQKKQKTDDTSSSSSSSSSTEDSGPVMTAEKNNEWMKSVVGTKKKVAILVGYHGTGFQGLQKNPGCYTIEGVLEKAIYDAGGIRDSNFDQLSKIGWQRASRTDKGVHAANQIIAAKLIIQDDFVNKINEHLPQSIRVISMTSTTKGFNAKNMCNSRLYEYILPTYALKPVNRVQAISRALEAANNAKKVPNADDEDRDTQQPKFEVDELERVFSTWGEPMENDGSYKVPAEQLDLIRSVLQRYIGTHSYHNFTSKLTHKDASAKRYITFFDCSEPFEIDGTEVVKISVRGQSFLLHQIRKMVACALLVARGQAPITLMDHVFEDEKVHLPLAPGFPLLLAKIYYTHYNEKQGKDMDFSFVQDDIETFKLTNLYPHIIQLDKGNEFGRWLYKSERYFLFDDDCNNILKDFIGNNMAELLDRLEGKKEQ